jgi:acetyl-CoA synthetase (ADP-forming)
MEHESKDLISKYGIAVGDYKLVNSAKEAVDFAKSIGYPVVAKAMSPDIVHKTEAGVIKLNLKSAEELENAYSEIIDNAMKYNPNAKIAGVNVQKMAENGVVEIIIGSMRDTNFGPVLMFGLGGIFVEIFKDVSYRVCPIKKEEANKMIRSIKAFPLLDGYRGQPKADISALIDTITKCCKLLEDNPEINELDLNPVIMFEEGKGLMVVDARIILEEKK